MAAPSGVCGLPHITSVRQALAPTVNWPPLMRWLPQMT
jgi:hypothetical protein